MKTILFIVSIAVLIGLAAGCDEMQDQVMKPITMPDDEVITEDDMVTSMGTMKDPSTETDDTEEDTPVETQTPDALFVSATPASGEISVNESITIEFDNDPGDVSASEGTVTGSGNTRTISGPFTVGSLALTITWPNGDGSHTLNYNVVADDTTSPMVTTSSTTNGAVDIDPATVFQNGITVTFNETIISGTLRLLKNGENVGWTLSIQNNTITLTPNTGQELSHDTMYQIVGTVKDAANNETDVSISFTTKSEPAPPPPQTLVAAFVSASPASGDTSEYGGITIEFDNDPGDVTTSEGTVTGSGNSRTISGPFTVGSLTLTITWPNGNGSHTLNYNVVADDTTSPMVTTSSTTNGAVDIDPTTVFENGITVTFNETIISGTLRLLKNGENVGWTSSIQNNTITLTPNADQELSHDTMYQIVGTVKDAADNETDVSISFTTKSEPAPPPPQTPVAAFVSATPASGNISENGSITINFDNDPGAVTASSGTVTGSGNSRTISGPFTVGSLALTITWLNGNGRHTLNYNVVADDTTSPMVTTSSTTNGAVDIDPATVFQNGITVTFNETIISGTLRLLKNGENVGWTSSIQNNTITLTPNADQELSHDTMYQIVGTVKDAADNETDVSISFTTKSEPAPPPPQTPVAAFVSATPASGNISENGSITINFDNDPGAVTASSGTVTGSGNSRTISGPFTVGSLALTITWLNGNDRHTLNYNVVADDTTSPMVTTSSTTNGAVDIDPATVFQNGFTVTFNETIISGTLRLLKNGENVGWTSSIQNNIITLTPNAGQELNHDTMYQIVGTVKDAADNETDVSISFTTKSAPAPPPPQTPAAAFVSATPATGNISENGSITINFDNDPGAVTASSGTVTGSGNSRTISGPFTVGSLTLTITWPNGNGSHTLNYNVVADDTTSPMVTTSSTTNGAVDIDPATLFENGFTVTFNETIISGTLRLLKNGENVGWTSSIQNNTITLTPNTGQELSHDTMYQIVGTVKDAADNETDVSISFTTKSEPAPVVTLDPGEGLSNGAEAPDFELLDGDGNTYSLSEYSGIVVIVFYRGGW